MILLLFNDTIITLLYGTILTQGVKNEKNNLNNNFK